MDYNYLYSSTIYGGGGGGGGAWVHVVIICGGRRTINLGDELRGAKYSPLVSINKAQNEMPSVLETNSFAKKLCM